MSICLLPATSPVLSHLTATLDGIRTIRTFAVEDQLMEDFDGHYEARNGVAYSHMGTFGWFQFNNNLLGALFNTAAVFACLLIVDLNIQVLGRLDIWVFKWVNQFM